MFYSRPLLEQRIREEKFRFYRTGSPFSVILFHPFRLLSDGNKSRKKNINWITKLLDQETRETDIKGWWDRNTISIIVLDTLDGYAPLLVEKLISKIRTSGYSGTESTAKTPFEIFNFPNIKRIQMDARDNGREEDSERPENKSNQNGYKFNSLINLPDGNFYNQNSFKGLIERLLDIVLSLTGLIVLSPLLILCALLIKIDSPGPVFYRQTRVGKGGRHFTFLKFRSMYNNVDEQIHKNHVKNLMKGIAGLSDNGCFGESSYKLTDEGRATRFGRFLRRASIDELPQLINVLKGDMTFIGPRPHPSYEVEQYNLWHRHRLEVKPGITGLGQVYGRFNTEYEDVYRMDLRYLRNKSLFLDLKILFKTIPAVLSRRGAR